MTFPTPYLELLILLAGAFPSGLSYSMSHVLGAEPERGRRRGLFLAISLLPFLGLLAATRHFLPGVFAGDVPRGSALLIGFPAILVVWAVEYGAGLAYSLLRTGRIPNGTGLHQFWGSPLPALQYVNLLLIVVGEELLFRRVMFEILGVAFGFSVVVFVIVSAVLYALNHSFLGPGIVAAKLASGVVYGLIFYWSGSVLAPIVAHAGYNCSLLVLLGRRPTARAV
jgi:membrane protease YdiL (CAAX protease family)